MMAMMDEDRDDDEGDDHYDDASTLRHKVELFFPEKFDLTPTFSVVGKEWKTYVSAYKMEKYLPRRDAQKN